MSKQPDLSIFKHGRHRRIAWNVSATRKRDTDGQLRNLFFGLFLEALPKGTDTPEGHYHNDRQLDTLENRYRAQQGQHKRETE